MDKIKEYFLWMSTNTNEFVAIFLVFIVYWLCTKFIGFFLKGHWERRKVIREKLTEYPAVDTNHPFFNGLLSLIQKADHVLGLLQKKDQQNNVHLIREFVEKKLPNNRYVQAMLLRDQMKSEDMDILQEQTERVIKEEKGRPYLIIFLFSLQAAFFMLPLMFMYTVKDVPYYMAIPVLTVILSFFSVVTRKSITVFLPLYLFIFFIYTKLSGAMVIYLFYMAMSRAIPKYVKKFKKKQENR